MEDYSEYYTYRRRPRREFNIGQVTKWLIILCVIVYFLVPGEYFELFMFNSEFIIQRPWTIITNAFFHGDLFHLLFNCFSVFLFGSLIELRHGSRFTIILFFSSVILANVLFGYFNPGIYGLGISGFVYALIGGAVILEPRARVIFPIGFFYTTAPVSIAGPIMFLGEVVYSIVSVDGVGHVAHAAGFIVGIILAYARKKRMPPVYEVKY
jgi:membrane associated rhomboid family serine protease